MVAQLVLQHNAPSLSKVSSLFCNDGPQISDWTEEEGVPVGNHGRYDESQLLKLFNRHLAQPKLSFLVLEASFSQPPSFLDSYKSVVHEQRTLDTAVHTIISPSFSEETISDAGLSWSSFTWESKCESGLLSLDTELSYIDSASQPKKQTSTGTVCHSHRPRKASLRRRRELSREAVYTHPLAEVPGSNEGAIAACCHENQSIEEHLDISNTVDRRTSLISTFCNGIASITAVAVSLASSQARMEVLSSQILSPASSDASDPHFGTEQSAATSGFSSDTSIKKTSNVKITTRRRRKCIQLKTFNITVTPYPCAREYRLNSHYYRIFALERCMRLSGKFDASFAGRARYVSEPRFDTGNCTGGCQDHRLGSHGVLNSAPTPFIAYSNLLPTSASSTSAHPLHKRCSSSCIRSSAHIFKPIRRSTLSQCMSCA